MSNYGRRVTNSNILRSRANTDAALSRAAQRSEAADEGHTWAVNFGTTGYYCTQCKYVIFLGNVDDNPGKCDGQ